MLDEESTDGGSAIGSSWFLADSAWARLVREGGLSDLRYEDVDRATQVRGLDWNYVPDADEQPIVRGLVRASRDTPLRPKSHGAKKRLIVAIAGKAWGKTTFKESCRASPVKVVDIDDIVEETPEVRLMRAKALRGKVSWSSVADVHYRGVAEKVFRISPDILLLHSGIEGVLDDLRGYFAIEEWLVAAPAEDEIERRIVARGEVFDVESEVTEAKLNLRALRNYEPSKGIAGSNSGTWTELWNRALVEVLRTTKQARDLDENVMSVAERIGGVFEERAKRVRERIEELGPLGVFLGAHLNVNDLIDRRGIEGDIVEMGAMRQDRNEVALCAYSLLCMDFPVQLVVRGVTIKRLCEAALNPLPDTGTRPVVNIIKKVDRRNAYPLKSHPGAQNKVNVYANEVFSRCNELIPALKEKILDSTRYHDGFSDDQLSSMIMYSVVLNPYFDNAPAIVTRMIRHPKGCKSLTSALKSLGLNANKFGAVLTECEALLGRGAVVPHPTADADYRVDARSERLKTTLHTIDVELLRPCIRQVIARECPKEVEFESVEEFWRERWEWCVNGAHSKLIERIHPGLVNPGPKLSKMRVHRRVFF